jgi:hypothetical protein
MIRLLLFMLLVPATALGHGLDIKSGGSFPPKPEVLALVQNYTPHLIGWTSIADRDRKRRPMVVSGYVYHDWVRRANSPPYKE